MDRSDIRAWAYAAPDRFLDAWKRGVKRAGPQYFKSKRGWPEPKDVDAAEDVWQLIPDQKAIEAAMGVLSVGEAIFLATLVGFYNGTWGHCLMQEHSGGRLALGDIANRLQLGERKIVADLMMNHTGW